MNLMIADTTNVIPNAAAMGFIATINILKILIRLSKYRIHIQTIRICEPNVVTAAAIIPNIGINSKFVIILNIRDCEA